MLAHPLLALVCLLELLGGVLDVPTDTSMPSLANAFLVSS